MKKIIKTMLTFAIVAVVSVCAISCGNNTNKCDVAEKVKLTKVVFNEVEFENAEAVKIKQECDRVEISGTVEAMSASQKNVFGDESVTHVVALKFEFDKERTLSKFEIKGNLTKVYSTNVADEHYVGSISDLLDNEKSEDSYTNLILSAGTESYTITSTYSDGSKSVVIVNMNVTLATAQA